MKKVPRIESLRVLTSLRGQVFLRVIHKGLGVLCAVSWLFYSVWEFGSLTLPEFSLPLQRKTLFTYPARLLVSPRPLQFPPRLLCHFYPLARCRVIGSLVSFSHLQQQTCWHCGKLSHIHQRCTASQAEKNAYRDNHGAECLSVNSNVVVVEPEVYLKVMVEIKAHIGQFALQNVGDNLGPK